MSRMQTARKSHSRQRGLAVVEFAIVLPLLLLIGLGLTELGHGLYQYNTLTKAVHDGARFLADKNNVLDSDGVVDFSDPDVISLINNTENLVVYGNIAGTGAPLLQGFTTADVTVTPEFILLSDGGVTDNAIKVSATYNFIPIFPALSTLGFSLNPTGTASVVERVLKI